MNNNTESQNTDENRICNWIHEQLDATVVSLEKQSRWRPAWNIEIAYNDVSKGKCKLHIRGDRGEGLETQPLDLEYRVLKLLAENNIPVPTIYGWIDKPEAIVMDYVIGQPYLGEAHKDPALHAVVGEYMDILARVHQLDSQAFIDAGLEKGQNWNDTALAYLSMAEKAYLDNKTAPDPLIEFVRRWLNRNIPAAPPRLSMLVGDCPQFMHDDGAITAIYDLEMCRIGDPMFDLASIRVRDINEPTGDLISLFKRYEQQSAQPLNYAAIHYYSVMQFIAVPMISRPTLKNNRPHPAFVEYLSWCLSTTPRALEAMADYMQLSLEPGIDLPTSTSRHSDALADLVAQCDDLPEPGGFFREHPVMSLANYALRADQLGPAIEQLELADVNHLLNQQFTTNQEAEAALEAYVLSAGEDKDAELLQLFHRRALRSLQLIQDYPAPIVSRPLGAIA